MLKIDFETRLGWLRSDNSYKKSEDLQIIISEKADDGVAKITCSLAHNEFYNFALEGNNKFPYLVNQKCADGILLERREEKWHLHIIECKRTVNKKTWEKVKLQFEGAILRMHGIMGILGIERVESISLYTAFRFDDMKPIESTSPTLLKQRTGINTADFPHFVEWDGNKISLLSLSNIPFRKIELDKETGFGNMQL